MRMLCCWAALLVLAGGCRGESAVSEGCATDMECKGDRICEDGRCREPTLPETRSAPQGAERVETVGSTGKQDRGAEPKVGAQPRGDAAGQPAEEREDKGATRDAGEPQPASGVEPEEKTATPRKPAHPLLGSWACSFQQGEYRYPPMPCSITRKGDKLYLQKLKGSQRIRGEVDWHQDRFTFSGTFYCPFGDCTRRVVGEFARKAPGRWHGTIRSAGSGREEVTRVTLVRKR